MSHNFKPGDAVYLYLFDSTPIWEAIVGEPNGTVGVPVSAWRGARGGAWFDGSQGSWKEDGVSLHPEPDALITSYTKALLLGEVTHDA